MADTLSNTIEINFKPSFKQWQAFEKLTDATTLFIGYGGSGFSGKSYLACYWILIMCLTYADTAWGLGRKELTTLKKTTLLTLFKVFAESNVTSKDYEFNQQLNIITFRNKSQIFLIDTAYKPSDPLYTRFGGYELTGCAIDESVETEYKAIDILFTRTGRRNNGKHNIQRKMLETFNPGKNHVYTRYYKPYTENTLKPEYTFIKALPQDNPSPEVEEYIQGILKTGSEITKQRLVYGNFEYDDDPAALMSYEKITDVFTNDGVESGDKYITADIARYGTDKTVIMAWSGFRVISIRVIAKNSIPEARDAINAMRTQYNVGMSSVIIDEDGIGGGVVDLMKGCKGFVANSRPLNDENYDNLKSQCYYKLSDMVNNNQIMIISKDTAIQSAIIEELEQVKQKAVDDDKKKGVVPKDKVKEVLGRSPDFSDALMMRMHFELAPKYSFKSRLA